MCCLWFGTLAMWLLFVILCVIFFFFFKQKTAYDMRISDWSSDVCSSDLVVKLFTLTFHGDALLILRNCSLGSVRSADRYPNFIRILYRDCLAVRLDQSARYSARTISAAIRRRLL